MTSQAQWPGSQQEAALDTCTVAIFEQSVAGAAIACPASNPTDNAKNKAMKRLLLTMDIFPLRFEYTLPKPYFQGA